MKKFFYGVFFIIIFSLIQYFYFSRFLFKAEIFSDIITFLSIIFGFYITSLAIFVTSNYVSGLYKIRDKEDTSVTLLHTLISNYRFGLILVLLSLFYFISAHFFLIPDQNNFIHLSDKILLPFLGIIIINFWYFYKMLDYLIKVVLQEAKSRV